MRKSSQAHDIVLQPGEYYFGARIEPVRVYTLLGSCIAITLWHPRKKIGGMCHYLLPSSGTPGRLSRGHYAEGVMDVFMKAVVDAGTRPGDYQTKLFGGGNMFPASARSDAVISVPRANIEAGQRLLSERGFRIEAADVGGAYYRRVFLELWSGKVWVQRGKAPEEAMK